MKTVHSAGILLCKKVNGQLFTLLAHSTQKNGLSITDKNWGIPKGKQESGETLWQTAQREFSEECGFTINPDKFVCLCEDKDENPLPFFEYKLKSKQDGQPIKKIVSVFLLNDILGLVKESELKCESIAKSECPEVDGYIWTTLPAASMMVMSSQIRLFDKLKEIQEIF